MDCPSCDAKGQTKARCEACGFTFPKEGEVGAGDDALSLFLGLVCSNCDAYNDPGTSLCMSCGTPLGSDGSGGDTVIDEPAPLSALMTPPAPLALSSAMSAPPSWMTPPTGNTLSTQFAMKKVDLASVGGDGLAAPKGSSGPIPVPPSPSPSSPPPSPLPSSSLPPPQLLAMPPSTIPPSSMPAPSPPRVKDRCWRCNTDLEENEKFCRNCGSRRGEAKNPAPPPPMTMVIPSFHAAQHAKLGLGGLPASGVMPGGAPSATMFFGAATADRSAKLILAQSPRHPEALHLMGSLCAAQEQRDEALELFHAAMQEEVFKARCR